jgi:hypothetical protein
MSSKQPSQNAIGRALNLSSAAIVKLKKQGMPVDSVESAQAWRVARQSIAKRKPEPAPAQSVGGDTFRAMIRANEVKPDGGDLEESHDKARTRREIAEANLAELREGELSRELVRKADIEKASYEAARALRDGLSNCAKRLGATVAVLTTPEECAAAIEREHRTLLQSWSKTMGTLAEQIAP